MKSVVVHSLVLCLISAFSQAVWSADITSTGCDHRKTVILLDKTVDDKLAAVKKLESEMNSILEESQMSPKSYLNNIVELSIIDDKGEHSSQWRVKFDSTLGIRRENFLRKIRMLQENYRTTKSQILSDHTKYTKSLLVEPISRTLRELKACDRLIIISDMCVVDGQDNQHEKGIFGTPPDLRVLGEAARSARYVRVERSGQKQPLINLIEAWWEDAFRGTGHFNEKREEQNATALREHQTKFTKPQLVFNKQNKEGTRKVLNPSKNLGGLSTTSNKHLTRDAARSRPESPHMPKPTIVYDAVDVSEGSESASIDIESDLEKPPVSIPRPVKEFVKAPNELARMNERKMVAMSSLLEPCFSGIPAGSYTFRIEVTQDGRVHDLKAIDASPLGVTQCYRRGLSGAVLLKHPDNHAYFFEETIDVNSRDAG